MSNPEGTLVPPRPRQRAALSCTECRRRKQRCNQARDRPCNHCVRRYPPVECVYEGDVDGGLRIASRQDRSSSRTREEDSTSRTRADSQDRRRSLPLRPPSSSSNNTTNKTLPSSEIHREDTPQILSRLIRETSPANTKRLQPRPGSSSDISSIFLVDQVRPEREGFSKLDAVRYVANFGPAQQQVGGSFMDSLIHLPVGVTRRNGELLHFFVQRLSPFISSIDGNDPSPEFTSQWITFVIQSPLVANLSILSAAYFQAAARWIDVETNVDAMTTRMRLISLINEHISARGSQGRGVSGECVVAVASLSYNELIYSDKRSVLAHMSGLRSMVNTRGGVENLPIGILRKIVASTDYQVACTFEIEPFLHPPRSDPITVVQSYPVHIDSPLLHSETRFSDCREAFGIEIETARLLDDMRFLTTSVHALASNTKRSEDGLKTTKFLKTVQWISTRLTSHAPSPQTTDFLHATIHAAAVIYTSSILSRNPLSVACTPHLVQTIWRTMWCVPLSRWKRIPGVFLWVLLVVNPAVREKLEGRFVKGMIAAGIIGIGVVDWDVSVALLTGFLKVQLWLGEREDVPIVRVKTEHASASLDVGRDPDWAFREG